jgi:hypothetical protein
VTKAETRFGKPFDLLLLCGAQTESGRSLHDINDVAPVVAEAMLVLADTPMRDAASGLANNVFRRLEELTPDGEPTAWGSIGIVNWSFPGAAVAGYYTDRSVQTLIEGWLQEPVRQDVERRLKAAGHGAHMTDVDELMRFVQDEEGKPRLGDYRREVLRSLKSAKVKARALPDRLRTFEETFEGRSRAALRHAARVAATASSAYASVLATAVRSAVDDAGPTCGLGLPRGALWHLAEIQSTLERQRDAMRGPLDTADAEAARTLEALSAACGPSRFGWLRPVRKLLNAYLTARGMAFRLRLAFDLTQAVLAALAEGQASVDGERQLMEATVDSFRLARARCVRAVEAFEARESTPVSEIIDRPLYTISQLQTLYRQTYGVAWEDVPLALESAVRQSIDGLSRWIGLDEENLCVQIASMVRPEYGLIAGMTADDYARWLTDLGETTPELLARDSEELAPALCRYDRARLRDTGAFEDTSFRIMGVPDRETSVLAGAGDALLVSTGDPERLTYLSIKLGLPASSLWHFERYQQAASEVARRGRIAQRIYPALADDKTARSGSRRPRRRVAADEREQRGE